jgi:protein-tyrosine-phosphatase
VSNLTIVTLCTGNAARSVMAGAMLRHLSNELGLGLEITTAGTLVVEGQPLSPRVRQALRSISELDPSLTNEHRSHQLTEEDCRSADLIIAMEASHVAFVRRRHAEAAPRTATLPLLAVELAPLGLRSPERLSALDLELRAPSSQGEVDDPAGAEQEAYDECAREIWNLCQQLAGALSEV